MKKITLAICFFLLFSTIAIAQTATLTITWTYDPANEAAIQGFNVYWGGTSQAGVTDPTNTDPASGDPLPYDNVQSIADPTARSFSVTVTPGTYFSRVTPYGLVDGVLDDASFSNESQCFIGLFPTGNVSCTITTN